MKTFDYIQDSGHGWIKVPVTLLADLAIADQVSHYSYYRAGFGYLEEDCDLTLFFNAYHARYGHDPKLRDRRCDRSRVRHYAQYNKAHFQLDLLAKINFVNIYGIAVDESGNKILDQYGKKITIPHEKMHFYKLAARPE
jgi:hypothetical protein